MEVVVSKVSIVGAYNTKFGSFVKKNKETGEVTDLKSLHELLLEAGRGAAAAWVSRGEPGAPEADYLPFGRP